MIELSLAEDADELAALAADWLAPYLTDRAAHLCVAAGGSVRGLYRELAERAASGRMSFEQVRFTQLDEWHGVPRDDPAACGADLRRYLLEPLGIVGESWLGFDSEAADAHTEVVRVAGLARRRGSFTVGILGLGANGHIGLNEPADALASGAHVSRLSDETRRHAMLRHLATPPTLGMTFGLGDLCEARAALVLVSGEAKREPLERLLHGPVTTHFPASLLRLHRRCVVFADRAAAGDLRPTA